MAVAVASGIRLAGLLIVLIGFLLALMVRADPLPAPWRRQRATPYRTTA
jgi:hypothetical protein